MHKLSKALFAAVRLVWPSRCAACDVHLPGDGAFCDMCGPAVAEIEQACPGCALPFDGVDRCPGCARGPFPFARADAAVLYGETVARAIVRMKHAGRPDLARPLGRLLAPALARAIEGGAAPEFVLPVPLHPRKLRARQFNQALALTLVAARTLRRQSNAVPLPPIARDLLRRVRDTPELGHGGRALRRQTVAGAFALRPGGAAAIKGRTLLVVDDVMTTGATLSECTRTLLAAGAAEVRVVALARVDR